MIEVLHFVHVFVFYAMLYLLSPQHLGIFDIKTHAFTVRGNAKVSAKIGPSL